MPRSETFQSNRDLTKSVVILDGQEESEVFNLYGTTLNGISFDGNFQGSVIKFKVKLPDGSFQLYKTQNSSLDLVDVQHAAGPDCYVGFLLGDFTGIEQLKIVSDTAQSGTNTTIRLSLKAGV